MEPQRLSRRETPEQAVLLPDGRRLHLHHGPIDLIIEAFGAGDAVAEAYRRAADRFAPLLDELVAELPALRTPVSANSPPVAGTTARRMVAACRPHAEAFITPMAAVASAVADEVLTAMLSGRHGLRRGYVNNGGDIALHLAPGERFTAGLVADVDRPAIVATAAIEAAMAVRGIATSGRGGRSFSLGIADAVTVLAATGAAADAAATLIGNAVSLDHPHIARRPACEIQPDSDLGALPVVVAVGALSLHDVAAALASGVKEAQRMQARGLIEGAFLSLRGQHRIVGPHPLARARTLSREGEGRGEG